VLQPICCEDNIDADTSAPLPLTPSQTWSYGITTKLKAAESGHISITGPSTPGPLIPPLCHSQVTREPGVSITCPATPVPLIPPSCYSQVAGESGVFIVRPSTPCIVGYSSLHSYSSQYVHNYVSLALNSFVY
jgi:hypothetical protein